MWDGRIAASRVFIKEKHARNAVDELALLLLATASPATIDALSLGNRSSDRAAPGVEQKERPLRERSTLHEWALRASEPLVPRKAGCQGRGFKQGKRARLGRGWRYVAPTTTADVSSALLSSHPAHRSPPWPGQKPSPRTSPIPL